MVQHVTVSEDRVPVTVVTSYALHEKYVKQLLPLEKAKQMSAAAYTRVCLELATLPPFPAYQLDVRGTWKRAELPRYNNYLLDELENEKSVFNTVFYGNVVRKYDVELKNLVACASHFEVSTLSRATLCFPYCCCRATLTLPCCSAFEKKRCSLRPLRSEYRSTGRKPQGGNRGCAMSLE